MNDSSTLPIKEDPPENEPSSNRIGDIEFVPTFTLKYLLSNYIILALVSGSILWLDQWTKSWVRANIVRYESWYPIESISEYFRIVNAQNTGAAFGLFKNGAPLFTLLAVVVTLVIIYYFPRIPNQEWAIKLALTIQLGGALGNLYDRLFFGGAVTDFIAFGKFPVFNVADSSITVGSAILILSVWISERREKLARQAELEDSPEIELGEQV